MKLSYKKLWVMLVERDLKKTEFAKKAGISSASLAKLGKGANVTTDVLVKIFKIESKLHYKIVAVHFQHVCRKVNFGLHAGIDIFNGDRVFFTGAA